MRLSGNTGGFAKVVPLEYDFCSRSEQYQRATGAGDKAEDTKHILY
jgi:hypothetical protein